MSVFQPIAAQTHPVVLRFAEMFPAQLSGYQAHGLRTGGDLSHVDGERSELNRILIGPEDWKALALTEIELMRHENLAEELEALKGRGRKKEMDARIREGLRDPWKASKGGPLREVILTASKDWFEAPDAPSMFGMPKAERESEFQTRAVEWLKSRFGDDVIHARADHDERTCHIHAIILPREEKVSKRRGRQRLLQPSVHPLIEDYEKAQDDVGAFFAQIGLTRGERGAEARRLAKQQGQPLPEIRDHIPPSRWREEEARRLKDAAKRLEDEKAIVAEAAAQAAVRTSDLDRREMALIAEQERQASQVRALDAQRAAAENARLNAEAREREADAVVAVAEAVEIGIIDFEEADGVIKPKRVTAPTPEERKIYDRMKGSGGKARGLLDRLGSAYGRMAARANERADARARSKFDLAETAIRAANDLRKRIFVAIPQDLRARFKKEIADEDSRVMQARALIEKNSNKPRGGRPDSEQFD